MPVLVDWLDADGMAGDLKELDLTDTLKVFPHLPHIMELLQAWVATKDAHELFLAAQQRHLPFGEVLTVAEVAHNPFKPEEYRHGKYRMPKT